MYTILHNETPNYLKQLLHYVNESSNYDLRDRNINLILPKPKTDYLKKRFSFTGSKVWNRIFLWIQKYQLFYVRLNMTQLPHLSSEIRINTKLNKYSARMKRNFVIDKTPILSQLTSGAKSDLPISSHKNAYSTLVSPAPYFTSGSHSSGINKFHSPASLALA